MNSHHTLTPIVLHIINTSELTNEWQKILGADAASK